jgi:hypothetical protein
MISLHQLGRHPGGDTRNALGKHRLAVARKLLLAVEYLERIE